MGEYHLSPSKTFCHTVSKIFFGELFGVSGNFGYGKILCIREGGSITFLRRKILSHSTKKFRWGTLRCIGKFRVTKKFMHERGRGYHISQSKTFCHTVPKNFVGEHFGVSENFGYRNILCIGERDRGGGEYHVSPSKTFCVTVPIKFVGEHFCVSKDFWYRIFEAKEGEASQFCRNFFYLTGPKKLLQGTNLFQKNSGGEKILRI